MLQQTAATVIQPDMPAGAPGGQAADVPVAAGSESSPGLRQLLVTVSPKLVVALKSKVDALMRSQARIASLQAAGAGQAAGQGDGSAGGGQQDGSGEDEHQSPLEDQLLDDQAVARAMGALPDKLAAVTDTQCPLVLPLRHLLLMLEASFPAPRFQQWLAGGPRDMHRAVQSGYDEGEGDGGANDGGIDEEQTSGSGSDDDDQDTDAVPADWMYNEVTFERWQSAYFTKLDTTKRKGLGDASALWLEIQSVIKGSKEAVAKPRKMLSREEYVGLEGR
jgi:hypothetical protein